MTKKYINKRIRLFIRHICHIKRLEKRDLLARNSKSISVKIYSGVHFCKMAQ